MMECFESSIFLRCLKKVGQVYLSIGKGISSIYLNSFTRRLIAETAELIKIGFKFSIFGRLTEIDDDVSRDFLETSKTIRGILSWIKNSKDKLIVSSATSNLVTSIRSLKYDFFLTPLKVEGIIVIVAITTNLVLLIILQKQITLWGWIMSGLVLFIGINGLFCNVDWLTLKTNSIFFKRKIAK